MISVRIVGIFNFSQSVILLLNSYPDLLYLVTVLLRLALCRDTLGDIIYLWLFLISKPIGFTAGSKFSFTAANYIVAKYDPSV